MLHQVNPVANPTQLTDSGFESVIASLLDAEDLLTTVETACLLKVKTSFLTGLRRRGDGPAFIRMNQRFIRYRRADIAFWLERFLHPATPRT